MMDQFRKANYSTEIKDNESSTTKDLSSFVFSKPILPPTSTLLPPKLDFAPPLLNGSIKFGSPSTNPLPTPTSSRYKQCLRNHAASIGGHVLDGCCEFMPSSLADPFKCMACGCHRSFHHKEPEPASSETTGEGRVGSETDAIGKGGKRKRFRTKFSGEQKEKMKAFAERVKWRVQKKDEGETDRFCRELGITRPVLRVWMHNNRDLFKNDIGNGRQDGFYEGRGIKVEKVVLRTQL